MFALVKMSSGLFTQKSNHFTPDLVTSSVLLGHHIFMRNLAVSKTAVGNRYNKFSRSANGGPI